MKRAIGIINLHNNPSLGKLTEYRPLGTVSFLGRYGIIDFALSNFSNSDISKIEILVEKGFDSIRTHIQSGTAWITNTKTGYLRSVINESCFSNPHGNTDIANIFKNVPEDVFDEDYIVIASPQFLMSIDYREVLKAHGDSGAGITIVYTHTKKSSMYPGCDHLLIDKDGTVRKFLNDRKNEEANVSVESYIINRDVFIGMLNFSEQISNTKTSIRNMIELFTNNKMVKVNSFEFKGTVFPILDLKQYIDQSFKMLDRKNREQLFVPNWPIYTTTHNTPPALYGDKASVINSFVANGGIINGKVKNSILSRDVTIEEGATVQDCIIFSRTVIGSDVTLKRVVTDKNVVIKEVKNLSGDDIDYLLIAKGAKI